MYSFASGISCRVVHQFQCTMVEGKTVNSLTGQRSSSSCNVCGASPKQINDLEVVKKLKCNEKSYEFGLSPLQLRFSSWSVFCTLVRKKHEMVKLSFFF